MHILIVTKAELTSLIASPDIKLIGVLCQHQTPILYSEDLLSLDLLLFQLLEIVYKVHLSYFT